MGKTYFVSDVHMRPHFARRASYFTALLHSIHDAEALYMLGDIFDYWVGVAQLRKALADPVFTALRALRRSGVKLYFLGGNRDFLVGKELTRVCGVEVLPGNASIRLGDLKVHLSHGDQFLTKDTDYLLFRTVVRNPLLIAFFKYLVPLFFRLWVAKGLRHSSKAVVRRKAWERRDINLHAVERVLARGFDAAICGHIHEPRHVELLVRGTKRDFYTLGHWDEGPSYLTYEDGVFEFYPPLQE